MAMVNLLSAGLPMVGQKVTVVRQSTLAQSVTLGSAWQTARLSATLAATARKNATAGNKFPMPKTFKIFWR